MPFRVVSPASRICQGVDLWSRWFLAMFWWWPKGQFKNDLSNVKGPLLFSLARGYLPETNSVDTCKCSYVRPNTSIFVCLMIHICRNEILRYMVSNLGHSNNPWELSACRLVLQTPCSHGYECRWGWSSKCPKWHQWLRSYLSQGFPVDWTLDSFKAPLHSKKYLENSTTFFASKKVFWYSES